MRMDFLNSKIIYLITNLFRIYVLFRFLSVFFERKIRVNKEFVFLLYIICFIINSSLHLIFSNPFINLASNILLLYLLTFMYHGKTLTRVVSTAIIYSSAMILDSIVYNISINLNLLFSSEDFTTVVSNILLFILMLILERLFGNNKTLEIKPMHLLMIFCIPIGSIVIISTAFLAHFSSIFTITIVSVLLFINIMNFYLYDVIIKFYHDKYEKNLLKQQNSAYKNQLKIIKESQESIKMLRHDMKNHILSMQEMIKNDMKNELSNYLHNIYNYVDIKKEYVYSGNTEIDSLLNYKIDEAKKLNSKIEIDVNMPSKIKIESFDLVIILGNLLDNALDALKNASEKYLHVKIELEKSILYITVENTYDGVVNIDNNVLLTRKKDTNNHGIGLRNVENTIKKYNGLLDINYCSNIFSVNILLYMD